jgi:hypothetical protein
MTLEKQALEKRGLRRCTRCSVVKALTAFHSGSAKCKPCNALHQAEKRAAK